METRLVIAYALMALIAAAAAYGLFRFATRHRRKRSAWERRHLVARQSRRKY